jgi:hypothetical protein
MSVFQFDEWIEVSNNPEFLGVGEPVRFQCYLHDSYLKYIGGAPYCVIKPDGTAGFYCFARKIEEKVLVKVYFACSQGYIMTHKFYEISKELADKIKAGDI